MTLQAIARPALITLTSLTALNAIGGGIYGILGAQGVPIQLLDGTPFDTWLIPSLILLIAVGGSQTAAAMTLIRRHPRAPWITTLAGLTLIAWILVQVALVGYISFLQPTMSAVGITTLFLARELPS